MRKDEAMEKLGFVESGPLNELDNVMAAFGHGFKRDFSWEFADELAGIGAKLKGKDYKTRRDALRSLHNHVKKEYPKADMAGRITSILAQGYLPGGASLGGKALSLLMARYGIKPLIKHAPKIAKYVQQSPKLQVFMQNMFEAGANVAGESKETEEIVKNLLTKPDMYMTAGLSLAGKGWDAFKKSKARGAIVGHLVGLDKDTRKYIRDNFNSFLPKIDGKIPDQAILDKVSKFMDKVDFDMSQLDRMAKAKLNVGHDLSVHPIDDYIEIINKKILSLFKKEGMGKYRDLPPDSEFEDVLNVVPYKTYEELLKKHPDATRGASGDWIRKKGIDLLQQQEHKVQTSKDSVLDDLLTAREFLLDAIQSKHKFNFPAAFSDVEVRDFLDTLGKYTNFKDDKYRNLLPKEQQLRGNTFNTLYGEINTKLKNANPEYKKLIEPLSKMKEALTGTPYKNIPGSLDDLGLQKSGDVYGFKDGHEGKALNTIVNLAMGKKGGASDRLRFRWKNLLWNAHHINKLTKRKTDFFVPEFRKELRNQVTQGIFRNPEVTPKQLNDFVTVINNAGKNFQSVLGSKSGGKEFEMQDLLTPTGTGVVGGVLGYVFPQVSPIGAAAFTSAVITNILRKKPGAQRKAVDIIVEAENYAKKLKKNPKLLANDLGISEEVVRGWGFGRLGRGAMTGASYKIPKLTRDVMEKPDVSEPVFEKPSGPRTEPEEGPSIHDRLFKKGAMQLEDSEVKQNNEEKTFGDLPEMFGAPPREPSSVPATTEKLPDESQFEPIKPRVGDEEDPMNPEEDDRFQREDKVQSFLDQQTGGKKPKQRYA